MKCHSKKQPLRYFFIMLITISILSQFHISDVQADAAPPQPPVGTNPFPSETGTNVRMMSETVNYEISGFTPFEAAVTGKFTMQNLGVKDEEMDVRFPLDMSMGPEGVCRDNYTDYLPISDFVVTVDGQTKPSKTITQTRKVTTNTGSEEKTVPCWALFSVKFPVGKNVEIKTTYTVLPVDFYSSFYIYRYVLRTGNGWKDTIGSADIIFSLPYEVNKYNTSTDCVIIDCKIDKNKVIYHFKNFNPLDDPSIYLVPPSLWRTILIETGNTNLNPGDGEAWGRLGKAYKESIRAPKGYNPISGNAGFLKSKEAYKKAVELLPDDAKWHYGFADLLCWDALWGRISTNAGIQTAENWPGCVEQIRDVFQIDPNHQKTKDLIFEMINGDSLIDTSGPEPIFLFLTPSPPAPVEETPISKP